MKIKKQLRHFGQTFFHIRVFVFILIGAGIIFLTFFTSNNALEIAISGVASVFIGIGVNNFSMLETHEKDKQKLNAQMLHVHETLTFVKNRINELHKDADAETMEKLKWGLAELAQLITFTIHSANNDDLLN